MKASSVCYVLVGLIAVGSFAHAADSGFLMDYSLLESRSGDMVSRAYVAPGAVEALREFTEVMVDQPEVHIAADSKYQGAKPDSLKLLADGLRMTVIEAFQTGGFLDAAGPGPGVVYMNWAVTDLYLQKKKRRLLSYTPAGFVIHATRQAAIRDVWRKVDIVELNIEAEFLDSVTGELLAAVVVQRGARKSRGQEQELVSWQDLDVAMRTLGQRVVCNFVNARKFERNRENCAAIVATPQP